jgi:hypothetical protein
VHELVDGRRKEEKADLLLAGSCIPDRRIDLQNPMLLLGDISDVDGVKRKENANVIDTDII